MTFCTPLLLLLDDPLEDQGHSEGEREDGADRGEEELDDLEEVDRTVTDQGHIGHGPVCYQLRRRKLENDVSFC